MSQVIDAHLQSGRDAFARHAWREAYELLQRADQAGDLAPEDLHVLGQSAWWCGRLEEAIALRERAYAAFLKAGHHRRAATVAFALCVDHIGKNALPMAKGWLARASQLLESEPDCPEQGMLEVWLAHMALAEDDGDGSMAHAERALDLGTTFGDRDLLAHALMAKGRALIGLGRVDEGLALLNESTVAAISGEITPAAAGAIYCMAVMATADLGEYRQAGEWSEAAKRWCDRQAHAGGFPGTCRIHRAEVLRLRGVWVEAEAEARQATSELLGFNTSVAAQGFYQIGEIRLRVGDLAEAEDAFRSANDLGRDPQPGLALLRVAQGKPEAALAALQHALADASSLPEQPMAGSPSVALRRARILHPLVDVAAELGRVDLAHAAAEELAHIAETFGTATLRATAAYAMGIELVATGEPAAASGPLRTAVRLWQEADSPYEVARSRVQLALAHRGEGSEDAAGFELEAARSGFERLGAVPDATRVMSLIRTERPIEASRAVRTFMFTDIVRSTNLVEAIGDDAWGHLLRWHDQTLRTLVSARGGEEVKQVGDGFFFAFEDAQTAVLAALDIQRQLRDHRLSHGFAPQVRIGLHAAEAHQKGGDYSGIGVNEAARIGALAEGGEILLSASTAALVAEGVDFSEPREMALKGISRHVAIVSANWA